VSYVGLRRGSGVQVRAQRVKVQEVRPVREDMHEAARQRLATVITELVVRSTKVKVVSLSRTVTLNKG
jgi:hypothetical protein